MTWTRTASASRTGRAAGRTTGRTPPTGTTRARRNFGGRHNFCYRGGGDRLFVFEAPIDLLSFLCLFKRAWQEQSYLSLGGVGEKAMLRFLAARPDIKTVYLCLDSDQAGSDACSRLAELVPEGLTVHRLVPLFKDWNEVLQRRAEITDGKYIREAVYGLKVPTQEETVEIIRMSEVDTQAVACRREGACQRGY